MKPFDRSVLVESVIEVARHASDQDIMIAIIFSTFYMRFFPHVACVIRGDA